MQIEQDIARIAPNLVKISVMNKNEVSINIKQLLIDTLSLEISVEELADDSLLLGDIPELDSMAIVSIITALEESFGFVADDDDLSAEVFESVETLTLFVIERMSV